MTYTLDIERNKYIAYIDITRYNEAMKQDLKKVALYSPKLKAWISRARKDSINIMKFFNVMKKYNILSNEKQKTVKKRVVKKQKSNRDITSAFINALEVMCYTNAKTNKERDMQFNALLNNEIQKSKKRK